MHGVLGLDPIEDIEGTGSYFLGKDRVKERPYGMKELFPDLYQDHDINKKNFESMMQVLEKKIKSGEREYQSFISQQRDDSLNGIQSEFVPRFN